MKSFLLILSLFSIFFLSSYRATTFNNPTNSDEKISLISLSLDTLLPGSVTLKQLKPVIALKAKGILPGGKTKELKVKSYTIAFTYSKPRKEVYHVIEKIEGCKLSYSARAEIARLKPGDSIMIGDIKILGVENNFKVVAGALWEIVEEH